jgi:hypothetical protein
MESLIPELVTTLMGCGVSLLSNPALVGPLLVYALARVPGPFRGLAEALARFLLERARLMLEERIRQAAADAVAAAEQQGGEGKWKKAQALQVVQQAGVDPAQAEVLIEAEVRRMNAAAGKAPKTPDEYEAQARADFEAMARDIAAGTARLPVVALE